MRPIVAVTCDRRDGAPAEGPNEHGRVRPKRDEVFVHACIVEHLRAAGAEVLLVPPADGDPGSLVDFVLGRCDGVVLTGGPHDIDPALYGEALLHRNDRIDRGRSNLELALAKGAWERDVPLLGLCGGMQAMAVALGGSLYQDIPAQLPEAMQHEQPTDPAEPWHGVRLAEGLLRDAFGRADIRVNSTHHQAVRDPGPLRVTGVAPDQVIEAIEARDRRFYAGVQWHPELVEAAPLAALVSVLTAGD